MAGNLLCSPSSCAWTRFLRHRIKKYPDSPVHTLSDLLRIYFFPLWPCPHVIGFVADIFFSTLESGFFFSGLAVEFAVYVWTVAVSGEKKLRIQKYPDTCGRGLKLTETENYVNRFINCTVQCSKKIEDIK